MKLRLSPLAKEDLDGIYDYIALRSADTAAVVLAPIRAVMRNLIVFPMVGHESVVPGTRQVSVPGLPYVVVYQVSVSNDARIEVLRVYHGAQDR